MTKIRGIAMVIAVRAVEEQSLQSRSMLFQLKNISTIKYQEEKGSFNGINIIIVVLFCRFSYVIFSNIRLCFKNFTPKVKEK